MATINCPHCAERIKSEAKVCKHCGHRFSEEELTARDKWLQRRNLLTLAIVAAVIAIIATSGDDDPPASAGSGSYSETPELAAALDDAGDIENVEETRRIVSASFEGGRSTLEPATPKRDRWQYSTNTDEVTGRTIHYARLQSQNTINLDFPYRGAQHLTATVRRHPRWGDDVLFSVRKGQIQCGVYECKGSISVDGAAEGLTLVPSGSNDSTTVFAKYTSAIRRMLGRGSGRVVIELPFYSNGNQTFIFEPGELEWPPRSAE